MCTPGWRNLSEQFGQEYRDGKNFKGEFRSAFRQSVTVYPVARLPSSQAWRTTQSRWPRPGRRDPGLRGCSRVVLVGERWDLPHSPLQTTGRPINNYSAHRIRDTLRAHALL
jgi:hypothetical protein